MDSATRDQKQRQPDQSQLAMRQIDIGAEDIIALPKRSEDVEMQVPEDLRCRRVRQGERRCLGPRDADEQKNRANELQLCEP